MQYSDLVYPFVKQFIRKNRKTIIKVDLNLYQLPGGVIHFSLKHAYRLILSDRIIAALACFEKDNHLEQKCAASGSNLKASFLLKK